jgi:hypothetical protein
LEEDIALLTGSEGASSMKTLNKAADIVRVLGGLDGVAKLTSANRDAVWQWHNNFLAFPSNTFVIMTDALRRLGYTAPARLWKMREIKVSRSATQKSQVTKKSRKTLSKSRPQKTNFIPKSRSKANKGRLAANQ